MLRWRAAVQCGRSNEFAHIWYYYIRILDHVINSFVSVCLSQIAVNQLLGGILIVLKCMSYLPYMCVRIALFVLNNHVHHVVSIMDSQKGTQRFGVRLAFPKMHIIH